MRFGGSGWIGAACSLLSIGLIACVAVRPEDNAQAGQKTYEGEYRVLEPLQSGALTLFPIVRNGDAGKGAKWDYITLDEGLRSGAVEVVEAGTLRGLVRPRDGHPHPLMPEEHRGDRVNTLVLLNNSDRPLILLAGEIVTGGKQDRIIGKDRIVPAKSDPIDLSVFCIEHGRWVESSAKFGVAGKSTAGSFMVQPSVRGQAMVKEDQQQVWDSVSRSVDKASIAAAAPRGDAVPPTNAAPRIALGTTSYAKALGDERVSRQVDAVSEPLTESRQQVLQKLRDEHAVGVIVAVHGEIVWADIFASPDLLAAYWTKLVRSYAAEALAEPWHHAQDVSIAQAQKFIDRPANGTETSEGETGVYRYREIRGAGESSFYLQVLLTGTDFYAHISRVAEGRAASEYQSTGMIR